MSNAVAYINDRQLREILRQSLDWSAIAFVSYGSIPCDNFRPEFEALAETFMTNVFCGWLDVDENPTITEKLKVQAVPTTVLYKNGQELARYEGPYSREALDERVRAVMSPKKKKGSE